MWLPIHHCLKIILVEGPNNIAHNFPFQEHTLSLCIILDDIDWFIFFLLSELKDLTMDVFNSTQPHYTRVDKNSLGELEWRALIR